MTARPHLWVSLLLAGGAAYAAEAPSALAQCYASSANRIAAGQCLDRRFAEVRTELSAAVAAVRERMAGLDAVTGRKLATSAFDRGQQAFMDFRESNCAWRAAQVDAGTGAGDVERDCMIRMTEDRTRELLSEVRSGASAVVPDAAPGDGPAGLSGLTGRTWRLTRLRHGGQTLSPSRESIPSIEFDAAGHVSGNASVNRFRGSCTIDAAGGLRWSQTGFATTRMAGPPELMRQEEWFLEAMRHAAHVRVTGDTLELADEQQTVLLTFER